MMYRRGRKTSWYLLLTVINSAGSSLAEARNSECPHMTPSDRNIFRSTREYDARASSSKGEHERKEVQ